MITKDREKRPADDFDVEPGEPLRWRVQITYRTEAGPAIDIQTVDEIEDIHHIIEAGPNFHAIEKIEITHNPTHLRDYPHLANLTLEQAARQ